ncbi:MAG: hypothetical protein NVV74_17300 [Magnetospirillum sp.]|nr:hypothetical protein [Magnetospirillum sp.]
MTATIEKLQGPAARLEGFIDALDGGRLFGWAWDRLHPQERLRIDVSIDGAVVASTTADQLRPDLRASGIGDGQHAFEVEVPEGASPTVVAISPSTGERLDLRMQEPEEQGTETLALLRRVAGAIDMLGRGQRRLGAVLSERDKAPPTEAGEVLKLMADLAAAQQELKKQQDCFEVFLVRFDGLLRDMAERMDAPPAKAGMLNRLFSK